MSRGLLQDRAEGVMVPCFLAEDQWYRRRDSGEVDDFLV